MFADKTFPLHYPKVMVYYQIVHKKDLVRLATFHYFTYSVSVVPLPLLSRSWCVSVCLSVSESDGGLMCILKEYSPTPHNDISVNNGPHI